MIKSTKKWCIIISIIKILLNISFYFGNFFCAKMIFFYYYIIFSLFIKSFEYKFNSNIFLFHILYSFYIKFWYVNFENMFGISVLSGLFPGTWFSLKTSFFCFFWLLIHKRFINDSYKVHIWYTQGLLYFTVWSKYYFYLL